MDDLAGLILRCCGAFYALGAVLGLRRCAMELLMTRALAALGTPDPAETGAETRRIGFQLVQILLVGLAGIALMALLELALALLLASIGLQALYALVIAPRLGRAGAALGGPSRMLFLAVTLGVAVAWQAGLLHGAGAASGPVLAIAALLALGLLAHAARLLRGMPRALPERPPPLAEEPPPPGASPPDALPPDGPMEADERLRHAAFLLSPSWDEGALFEAQTRRPVVLTLPPDMLTEADRDALRHWLGVFRAVADPDDPWRCGFSAPDGAARMAAEGRWVFDRLAARLAPCPLRFEPVPWPRRARHDATAVRVMAEQGTDALWLSDAEGHQAVNPQEFGLSWALALDLHGWALDFDAGTGWDGPGGAPRWSAAEAAAHEAAGRQLALRLARELAATGRGHLPVHFWSESEARAIPVRA